MSDNGDPELQKYFLRLYQNQLRQVVAHYENDLNTLLVQTQKGDKEIPDSIIESLQQLKKENIADYFSKLFNMIFDKSSRNSNTLENQRKILIDLDRIIENISRYTSLRVEISEFFNTKEATFSGASILSRKQKISAIPLMFRKGIKFLQELDGIVIFGGYPYEFRQNDGYFQRVKSIDNIFQGKETSFY